MKMKSNRKKHLEELISEKRTMIFYEAPHKLAAALNDMLLYFGDRNICIVKEITKIYESAEYTTLSQAQEKYKGQKLRGEYVLIVEGAPEETKDAPTLSVAANLAHKLRDSGMSASDAAKAAAAQTGVKKGDIYKELLKE